MVKTRHFFLLIAVAIVVVLLQSPAEAFFGFGSGRSGEGAGLDLEQGYDRNTVVMITGRVAVAPDPVADPVTVEVIVGSERFVVVLGPRWYLQDDHLDWKTGETLSVRGSKAQGKDGRSYLLAQWVKSSSGSQLVLRSQTGRTAWSGGLRGSRQSGTGQLQRGGSGGGKGH